jgi:hypothetical protein
VQSRAPDRATAGSVAASRRFRASGEHEGPRVPRERQFVATIAVLIVAQAVLRRARSSTARSWNSCAQQAGGGAVRSSRNRRLSRLECRSHLAGLIAANGNREEAMREGGAAVAQLGELADRRMLARELRQGCEAGSFLSSSRTVS